MDDVYGGREISIIAPYDPTVSAMIMEESLPAWLDAGWTLGVAQAADASQPVAAPQDGAVAPVEAPKPVTAPGK